jgi:HAE1 family hydrophobic/amphiphilic exporter-1
MSKLARLSLANRSLIALISLAIVAFGVVSTGSLKQELIPSLQLPGAFIVTSYPGASPEIVEREVTEPIENAISGVDGLDEVTSTSSNGFSMVQASFAFGTDIDKAVQDIQQAVDRASSQLPDDVDPSVQAGNFNDFPVVMLAVSSTESQQELAQRLEERVVPELRQLPDVRDVEITGVRDEVVAIRIDNDKLRDAGLTTQSVIGALQANGIAVPGGQLSSGDRSVTIEVGSTFSSLQEIRDLPIMPAGSPSGAASGRSGAPGTAAGGPQSAGPGGPAGEPASQSAGAAGAQAPGGIARPGRAPAAPEPVKLGDVATVERALAESSSITRTNGRETLGISVTKTADGNTVTVSHAVQDKLDDLREQLGENAELTVVFDQAPFIEESIEGLTSEGTAGLFFAVLVILVFLLSIRSTLVTAMSIPFSVLVAMIGLYAGGYSLNILTLGALTVAIGRVVDDSIVVLENIKRHLGYGETKHDAIMNGVREVAGAITASTLTTVGVFLPIAFVSGQVGELFRPFGVTVTIALLASLLVSLTIIPVLAYWFLRPPAVSPGDEARVRDEALKKERRNPLQRAYVPVIRWTTRHRATTILAGLLTFVGTLAATPLLKTNFLDDSGDNTLNVTQVMPVSTSLERTDEAARKVEAVLDGISGIESYQTTVGSAEFAGFSSGNSSNEVVYWIATKDDLDQQELADTIRERLAEVKDAGTITVQEQQTGFGNNSLEVIVTAPTTEALRTAAAQVERAVRKVEGITDVTNNLASDLPTIEVDVDREKAARVGLSDAQIGQAVREAFEGQDVGAVELDGNRRDVMLYTSEEPGDLAALRRMEIPTPLGTTVELRDVAQVSEATRPAQLTRIDGERSATVSATPNAADLGRITADLRAELEKLDLPAGASWELGGVSAEQAEAFTQLGLSMLAAIVIVFAIMVATFRSLIQPLILLVSVPFAATGALGMLLLTDTALGVPALIGLLMLVGIVVTNAIVLIDLINQYRAQGMSVREAVVEGGRRRLRPILMTALATICALVPMALGLTGGGVFISRPLALVVIGGLVSSTLLTLILVPTLYTMVEGYAERRAARRARRAHPRRSSRADTAASHATRTDTAAATSAEVSEPTAAPAAPAAPDATPVDAKPVDARAEIPVPSDTPPSQIGETTPTDARPGAASDVVRVGGNGVSLSNLSADERQPGLLTGTVQTPSGEVRVEVFVRAVPTDGRPS